jgi:prophage antirepressor-like protein
MRSHASNAEPFQDWVCEEVLPSIRRTGSYGHKPQPEFDPNDPIQIRKLLDVLNAQALKDQEAIQALKW